MRDTSILWSPEGADAIERVAQELGVSLGFLISLRDNDDWSFVIKVAAIMEAALSVALTNELSKLGVEEDMLDDFVARLTQERRIALARSTKVIRASVEARLKFVCKLRNKLAHNTANLSFNFTDFFAAHLDIQNEYRSVFRLDDDYDTRDIEFVLSEPKLAFWLLFPMMVGLIEEQRGHGGTPSP